MKKLISILMAGMMGIDTSLFEAAQVDGATSKQVFFRITLPLLRPILVYTLITSLIGGIQMFDVPQILTNGTGKKYNILMVPGSSFACPGYVRLAYCVSYEKIVNSEQSDLLI